MKYKLTIETPDDVLTIQCNNIESVKRFADCVAGFISPGIEVDNGSEWVPLFGYAGPAIRDAVIDVKLRNGKVYTVKPDIVSFEHHGFDSDIIAYRLHKSEEKK